MSIMTNGLCNTELLSKHRIRYRVYIHISTTFTTIEKSNKVNKMRTNYIHILWKFMSWFDCIWNLALLIGEICGIKKQTISHSPLNSIRLSLNLALFLIRVNCVPTHYPDPFGKLIKHIHSKIRSYPNMNAHRLTPTYLYINSISNHNECASYI